jgi:hypothetical protein
VSRHIYAHWLDPDYLGEHAVPPNFRDQRLKQFEGMLKMHALVGDSIDISDVQLIASPLILSLFQDATFVGFIQTHPDFLRLVAAPRNELGAVTDRLGRVESGLVRIWELGESYIPHTFDSPQTIREVVRIFRGTRDELSAEALFALRGELTRFVRGYRGADKFFVVGLYKCLQHFIFNQQAITGSPVLPGASSYYYLEMESIREQLEPEQRKLKALLSQTMKLATTPEDRFKRGRMLVKLPNAGEAGHPDREKYLTIIQAWNVAVGRTIGADMDSAYCFRDVFPFPVYSGSTRGATTFLTYSAAEREMFSDLPHYDWHPASVSWDSLGDVRTNCRLEISAFQDSLTGVTCDSGDANGVVAKLNAMTKTASKIIAKDQLRLPTAPPIAVSACAATQFATIVASVAFGLHPAAVVTGALTGLVNSYAIVAGALKRANSNEIGEALQAYGLQYNLHRTSAA